jgi:NADH-quinone oxidoreductase subunit G
MTDAPEFVTITVDGKEMQARPGELLIKAAEDNGTYIPRFCWHPRMSPVGMCRMCLVEIETPRGMLLVPSCMQPVADGMVVETASPVAKKAQEGVLEFLLVNHPLDCPVCDRGGECPLQDQTMSYGPGESRFVEEKRHYEKPLPLSDLVLMDRERCILCARCTRFSDEISGDPLIEFQERGNNTQVFTFPDEPFASYFSGNTVQICPVGALTATPYRFRARPWDLTAMESTSPFHTEGSRITVHASQNQVLRFLGVDNGPTNQGWLSDKERFGFEHIGSPDRLTTPLIREFGELHEATWGEAIQRVAERLSSIITDHGPDAIGAIGGARGTNEDAYALSKFMRVAVGTNNLDAQLDDGLNPDFLVGVTDRARIDDLERAGTILVWAADLKEENPILYLRVRRAAQELGATLIVVHPTRTGLDDRATHKFTYVPGTGADLLAELVAGDGEFADARAALDAGPVVAIVGRTGLAETGGMAEAVAAFARDLPDAKVMPLVRRGNTYGALDMGVAPTLLPGRLPVRGVAPALSEVWGDVPKGRGLDTIGMIAALNSGELHGLVLVGADPVRDVAAGDAAAHAIDQAEFTVAIDLFLTDSAALADVVLPAEGFTEKEGTMTNLEGRVQKVNRMIPGPGQSRPDWSILDEISTAMGAPIGLSSAQAIAKEIASVAPAYVGVTWELLEWDQREGAVVPMSGAVQPLEYIPVNAVTDRRPDGLGLHLARKLYDDGSALRHSLSLAKLAPGVSVGLTADHAASLGVGEGDQVTVTMGSATVSGPVVISSALAEGTVSVPFNQPGSPTLDATGGVEVRVGGGA